MFKERNIANNVDQVECALTKRPVQKHLEPHETHKLTRRNIYILCL